MLRIKSQGSDILGTVNLTINDQFQYSNQPIFMSRITSNLLPNTTYCFETSNCNIGDPMIFIESLRGKRIIDFNDDAGSGFNAKIERSFSYAPYAIQLNNYSSLNPITTCSLTVTENSSPVYETKHKSSKKKDSENRLEIIDSVVLNSLHIKLDKHISAKSVQNINLVECFDIQGKKLGNITQHEKDANIPILDLGVSKPGMYLIKFTTETLTKTFKILVD